MASLDPEAASAGAQHDRLSVSGAPGDVSDAPTEAGNSSAAGRHSKISIADSLPIPPTPPIPTGPTPKKAASKTKRSRWATRKMTIKSSNKKRMSIIGRANNKSTAHDKRISAGSGTLRHDDDDGEADDDDDAPDAPDDQEHDGPGPRNLYFNIPLPEDQKDEDGLPVQSYARNKIRTAKYTPLSFVPKNLYWQFQAIANMFFLFLVILTIFPIFGGSNPGLNAVPLIAIVVITAIRDAVEDVRRTLSDKTLNNSPVYRLVGYDNVNVREDSVSPWRKVKKATSRFISAMWHSTERLWKKDTKKNRPVSFGNENDPRMSIETRRTRPETMLSPYTDRTSYVSAHEDIPMTPVPSPSPRHPPAQMQDMLSPGQDANANRPISAFSFVPGKDGKEAFNLRNVTTDVINHDLIPTGDARFHRSAWKDLQVGDYVRIFNDDELPADVVILATSDPDGACYIETKNLDGETNLKFRQALRCGRNIKHARDCERAQFYIESEPPHANLYKYSGAIRWSQQFENDPLGKPREMSEPITIDNVLLRGCNLRNTEWALGVVLFTGHDTKIMMNAGETPSKRARVARELNFNVICNFVVLFVICLVAAIDNGVSWAKTDASLNFFDMGPYGGTAPLAGFVTFWAAVILFQNLVPISLYISLEIVRTLQAVFIYSDVEMYYDVIDQPCIPKSWNISDDVGQIEYIFSDKTGTLTQNVMEFKKATINGQPYGEAYTEAQAGMRKRLGIDVVAEAARARADIADAKVRALAGLRSLHDNPFLHDEDVTFIAPDFVDDISGKHGPEQQAANERFMLALALCHTVLSEKQPGSPPRIIFKAQSPDEAALVSTARDMGFTVLGNTGDGIRLNVMGEERYYPVLTTIEFNSTRKRMTAIVRMPDNQIVLFCKGADSIIYSRLKRGEQAELRKTTAEHLEMFAREGLRTLCIAQRILTEEEYYAWRKIHDAAATALDDREEKMEEAAELIEQDLSLIGGTAIEDRLQDGVPDTIALLAEAGIKLWVLTGDKVETAINIGFSCNLLNNDMELIHLKVDEDESGKTLDGEFMKQVEAELDRYLQIFNMTGGAEDLAAAKANHEPPAPTHAIVIDGFTLRWVLSDSLSQKFLLLCKQCKSVLCCRVSPAQKAAVCGLVKNGLDVMTLSIGDGANDVAMIQEADVGVGIAGVEGRQAVMSSDYAIGQFRFLQRLVLVHGRWSYRRMGEAIANFFYKNIIWVFSIFWFQIYCNFDMTYVFDYTYILMFNLFFTSVPVILMGVLDQDVSDAVSLAVPQLYRRGIERLEWTQKKFWLYMIDGVYQSVLCFFIPYLTLSRTTSGAFNGMDVSSRLQLGAYIAHPTVFTINMYILINTYRWDWLMLLVVSLSDLFVFFWTGVYSSTSYAEYFYKTAPQIYGQATFWAVFFITPIMCLFPRYALKAVQKVYFPYDVDIIREQVQMGMFKDVERTHGGGKMDATDAAEKAVDGSASTGGSSSEGSRKTKKPTHTAYASVDEDRRPIYPPSVATHNTRTQNGSDDTNYSGRHGRLSSIDDMSPAMPVTSNELGRQRQSIDRARPSYDRMRMSMDRVRPSFEASNEFTSAKRLSMLEGSISAGGDGSNIASGSGTAAGRFIQGRLRGLSIKGKQS
ncbi:phospholipid-translocating p-type ATPase-like protein [Grosmannia clavigera kw1407]|uniref:Phospholipid-transporting ATPase n=1 Tax=Grosmannia clavigera (strain kw1407 / UAMH 11150) TaxID=655863 RepID=F0XT75_GROCL|nr:phospholipid-translocating p-type ATPase-like protein [Grosmannia clavigera kw1407]EFW99129.1 phospholipid-translocating p-type ATPase-like protein [Grosmannia clavigera kw1407]